MKPLSLFLFYSLFPIQNCNYIMTPRGLLVKQGRPCQATRCAIHGRSTLNSSERHGGGWEYQLPCEGLPQGPSWNLCHTTFWLRQTFIQSFQRSQGEITRKAALCWCKWYLLLHWDGTDWHACTSISIRHVSFVLSFHFRTTILQRLFWSPHAHSATCDFCTECFLEMRNGNHAWCIFHAADPIHGINNLHMEFELGCFNKNCSVNSKENDIDTTWTIMPWKLLCYHKVRFEVHMSSSTL